LEFTLFAIELPPDNLVTLFPALDLVSYLACLSYQITHLQFHHREELKPILKHLCALKLLHMPLSIFCKDTMQWITRGELIIPVLKKLVCCVCFEPFRALMSMVMVICSFCCTKNDNLGASPLLELEVCVLTSDGQEQQHSEAVEAMKQEVPDSCMIMMTCRERCHHW
jgi:hypothetical protein